jgi:hypothetical protein
MFVSSSDSTARLVSITGGAKEGQRGAEREKKKRKIFLLI